MEKVLHLPAADIAAFDTKSKQKSARAKADLNRWEKKSARSAAKNVALSTTVLTLGACVGSSSSKENETNTEDDSTVGSAVSFVAIPIDFQISGFSNDEIFSVLSGDVDGQIFLPSRNGINLIFTPSQDGLSPGPHGENRYFPLTEFNITLSGLSLSREVSDYEFVASKPYALLTVNGSNAIVVGGHGPEYRDGRDWPFGNLWVGTLNEGEDIV